MNRVTFIYTKKSCPKCGGTGTLNHYHHIDGGRCFKCNGSGEVNDELVRHIKTVEEMRSELEAKGIIFANIIDETEQDDDDWEAVLFGTPEENAFYEKVIATAYAAA